MKLLTCMWFAAALCLISAAIALGDELPATRNAAVSSAEVPRPEPVEPPSAETIRASITRGVDFLLADQNKDGSWGGPTRTKGLNIYAPVPGAHHAFRAAVTSLGIMALIDAKDPRPEVASSIDRGEAWLLDQLPRVRRATPQAVYNIWTHAYAIDALLRLKRRARGDDSKRERIGLSIDQQVELLGRYESVNGGWGYYDFVHHTQKPASIPTSFSTATCLIALLQARAAGHDVPDKLIKTSVATIRRQRKPDFSYLYSGSMRWRPMYSLNRPGGSLGRSQVCNLALRMAGDEKVTDQVLTDWLDRLIARNLWLDIGRKRPVPHESYFAVAGYFFYYGHYYATHCVLELPEPQRAFYQAHLARILLPLQEKDGSWWDFPFYNYHQQYGTAMAIMSLVHCQNPRLIPKAGLQSPHTR